MRRKYNIGQSVKVTIIEFDGVLKFSGIVTEVNPDHVIVTDQDGLTWWIDDYNEFWID